MNTQYRNPIPPTLFPATSFGSEVSAVNRPDVSSVQMSPLSPKPPVKDKEKKGSCQQMFKANLPLFPAFEAMNLFLNLPQVSSGRLFPKPLFKIHRYMFPSD